MPAVVAPILSPFIDIVRRSFCVINPLPDQHPAPLKIVLASLAGRTYPQCVRLLALATARLEKALLESSPVDSGVLAALQRIRQLQAADAPGAGDLHALVQLMPDQETRVRFLVGAGCCMEQHEDFEAAVFFYGEAVASNPQEHETRYFALNNLGFSLNQLGHFEQGRVCCREAIKVDPKRCNAHKNCGLAEQGLGRFRKAARCFVAATDANARDPRSLDHLEELLETHPELRDEFEGELQRCRRAVLRERRGMISAN